MNNPSDTKDILLSCEVCRNRKTLELSSFDLQELVDKQRVKLDCDHCNEVTGWCAVEADRRIKQRRSVCRVPVEIPIRVRCDSHLLQFDEFTKTISVSREGARFMTEVMIAEGTEVFVSVPYREGDALPERRARVVRVDKVFDGFEVGIEFVN